MRCRSRVAQRQSPSLKVALPLNLGCTCGFGCGADRRADSMVAHSAGGSSGGIGHPAYRRWPAEGLLVTDGSRIYFNDFESHKDRAGFGQGWGDSTGGNRVFPNRPCRNYARRLLFVGSKSGSGVHPAPRAFMVDSTSGGRAPQARQYRDADVWSGYLSGRSNRFLSIDPGKGAQRADDRIDWFIADKDGLNPHKLVSLPGSYGYPSVSPSGQRIVARPMGSWR